MVDKIKHFFKKKKMDTKFKTAGPGFKLSEESSSHFDVSLGGQQTSIRRSEPSLEAKQAAAAALARFDNKKENTSFNTSLAAIQAQVRREIEAERKKAAAGVHSEEEIIHKDSTVGDGNNPSPFLAVNGVYFRCPIIGPEILPRNEWNVKVKEFLYEQLSEERGLTACLIIYTCNKNKEKVEQCVETLCKYLENITLNPTEEKFRKIRMSNRVYQEKVSPLEGTMDFLFAAGFEVQKLPFNDGEEDFLVFSEENLETLETLQVLCDALRSAEPIGLELDRNLQVLLPSQAAKRSELPSAFFNLTPEELKREHQSRIEAVEKSMMLRTKAMREKEEQRELKKYKYSLIRIRFPDGIILQGTFNVYEKFNAVVRYIQENLWIENLPFNIMMPTGHQLMEEDEDRTLLDLHLAPAVLLTLIPSQKDNEDFQLTEHQSYLKPEIMLLVQSL